VAVSLTPNSGFAAGQTFSAVYSDPNGAGDLTSLALLFNASVSGANACYISYNPNLKLLYLTNDQGTAQSSGVAPGSAAAVSNSQCTLAGSGSSYALAGNTATLSVALSFSATVPENVYLYAAEKNGTSSGWVLEGSWGLSAGPPAAVSVTPSSGFLPSQTFAALYSDPNGAADLTNVALLFNTSVSAAAACYVSYNPKLNLLYLTNDADTGQSAGVTPGSSASVANSQCTLSGTGSSYAVSGNAATLSVALSLNGSGPLNIYLYAAEKNGSNSGWAQKGSWGLSAGPPAAVSITPSSGFASTQSFAAIFSDPNGAADLSTVSVLFNSQVSAANGCFVSYNPILKLLFLTNDIGTAQSAGIAPGSLATAANSQCSLAASGSSYTTSGHTATLNLSLTFKTTAPTAIYLYAAENNGSGSGWVKEGSWGVSAGPPVAVSVTPNSGFAVTTMQNFSAVYSDPNGASDLATVAMLFNSQISAAHGCYVSYNPILNLLYLTNDAGTSQFAGIAPGSAASVSNSQCTLAAAGSSYSIAGNEASLTVALAFSGSAPANIYLYAAEKNGTGTGWVREGSWIFSAGPPTVESVTPSSGSGTSNESFAAVVSDPNGAADLTTVSILFNKSVTATHGCFVSYNPVLNLLYLTDDADTGQSAGITPGSPATVSNSQCKLAASGSSYTVIGDSAILTVLVTLSGAAPQGIFVYAEESNGSGSGWVQMGSWGLSLGPPSSMSITPSSGSSIGQVFAAEYSDPNGAADLSVVSVLFNNKIIAGGGCFVSYNPTANLLYLTNDLGTGQSAGIAPGSPATVANSQCTLSALGSAYAASGNTATLTLALTFSGTSPTNIYLYSAESNGSSSGWLEKGVWGGVLLNSIEVTLAQANVNTFSEINGNIHLATPAEASSGSCNGQAVSISLDNAALGILTTATANPASTVCIPAGSQDMPFQLIAGSTTGSGKISAFAPQVESGTVAFLVSACQVSLALASPTVGQGNTLGGVVTLCEPAPSPTTYGTFPNGITVNFSSSPAGSAEVNGSVTIPSGQSTGVFTVNAINAGPVTLSSAPIAGFSAATVPVTITSSTQAITIPRALSVAAGQTLAYPVTIGAPAASPVVITFSTSGAGSVTITPATVIIPAGAAVPPVQPQITGGAPGTVFVTAIAPNYGSDTESVNPTTTLTLSPGGVTVGTASAVTLALNASSPAPAGGYSVALSLSDPSKASVPAMVMIPAGQSATTVTLSGLAAGDTTLQASGSGFTAASAAIHVASAGSFSMIGDSRAAALNAVAGQLDYITAYQWFNAANALNGHNMLLAANYGIAGDRSDQFLNANLAAALSDTAGTLIFNSGAVNDIGQCWSSYLNTNGVIVDCSNVATVAASNIISAANAALGAGKRVILVSETGNTGFNPGQVGSVFEYNQLLQAYAASTSGVHYFDATPYYWSAATTATSIAFNPNVSVDGLHPNTLGSFYIGQAFGSWLAGVLPSYQYSAPAMASGSPADYLTNSLFQNPSGGSTIGAVSGAVPSGYSVIAGAGTTISATSVPDPSGVGNDLVLSLSATAADTESAVVAIPQKPRWSAGDSTVSGAQVSVAAGSANFYCFLQPIVYTAGGFTDAREMVSGAIDGPGPAAAYVYDLQTKPLTIPPAASGMSVNLKLNFTAAGSAVVTISHFDSWKLSQ